MVGTAREGMGRSGRRGDGKSGQADLVISVTATVVLSRLGHTATSLL